MPKGVTLLDRARADLTNVTYILASHQQDELQLDIAAYHVQQAIEKAVKFALQVKAVRFERTHDMDRLCTQCEKAGIQLPDWIYDNIDTLNAYATQTRYGSDIVASYRKISMLADSAKEFIHSLTPAPVADCCCSVEKIVTK